MTNISKTSKYLTVSVAVFAITLILGLGSTVSGQTRDPFAKPGWAQPKTAGKGASGPGAVINLGIPPIESRIDYYKKVRESAVGPDSRCRRSRACSAFRKWR